MSKSVLVFLSSLKMALATFISRILGLVREQVMASVFGAGHMTDAFLVAYRIPNLLRDLFAEGAFSSAFVPIFVESNKEGKKVSNELLWSLFILLISLTGIISFLMIYFAPELISLFAPTFKDDPSKFEVTVWLTRIMSPFLTFVSLAALFMGALNSLKVFFIPALAPAFFNIVMIVFMLTLPSYLIAHGYPAIYSIGLGVLFGGFIQGIVQIPFLIKRGYFPELPRKIFNVKVKKVFIKLGPGLIGFAATQVNLLINTILASSSIVGAVSFLSYSFRLFQLPIGILSVSLGNSNLVHFSDAWKEGEHERAKDVILSSSFLSFLLIFPAFIILLSFGGELVELVFERGKFDAYASLMTSKALFWYTLGLPIYGLYKILVPTFYAIDLEKVPVVASIISIILNIIFCVTLTPVYGFEILAMGTTLSIFINTNILLVMLKRKINFTWSEFFNLRILKIFITTALILFLFYFRPSYYHFSDTFFLKLLEVGSFSFLSLVLFGLILFLMGERSFAVMVFSKLKNKLKRSK